MTFKIGAKVVYVKSVYDEHVERQVITTNVVTWADRDIVRLTGESDPRYAAFVWPDVPECRQLLEDGLAMVAERKRLEDLHFRRTLELANEMVRQTWRLLMTWIYR